MALKNKGGGRLGEKLPHLSEAEGAILHREIEDYLARTGTSPMQLSIWARGYPAAIYLLLKNPIPTIKTAAYFRAAMANHPNGKEQKGAPPEQCRDSLGRALAKPRLKADQIAERREEKRQARSAHFAACRDAHFKRYGPDAVFGARLRKMRA